MLEYLRNAADKPFAKFLMFVLIFSFVGWGVADWIFGGASRETTLIKVGDSNISVQEFNNERSRQLSLMSKDEQRSAYTDPAKSAELTASVMSTLTMNRLALNRAHDLGLFVSDKRIAKEIKSYPQFQSNGQFVPWLFDMVMQNSGMNERDFANSLRMDLLRQMAVGATSVPLKVPEFAIDAAYNARYAKRDIKYSTVKFKDFKVANPTDEQLQSYYAQNPILLPETRSVSYVFVPVDMNKPDLYESGFKTAQQIEDMIISGDTMKVAADKHKAKFVQIKKLANNGKSGDKVLNADLVAKLFAMDSGVESELIELKNGFAILRVDEIHVAHNADFKDVKKSLVDDWKKAEQRKQAYIKANEDLVNLKQDAKSLKNMKSASVSRTEGAPLVVLNAAFAGHTGDNVIVEDNDAFYVLNIDKTIAPKSDKTKKQELRKELQNMSVRYVADDYSQFLKRHYSVKVNDKVYNRFIAK